MALFAQLVVIRTRAEKMLEAAKVETAFLEKIQKHSGNVSDKDTVKAIANIHEVLVHMNDVVKSIYAALEHLDKEARKGR